jgi:SAM-dependent methyltransferase
MHLAMASLPQRLPWPLPALLAWAAGWGAAWAARGLGLAGGWELAAGTAAATALAWPNPGPWRRLIAASGFPLSVLLLAGPAAGGGSLLWLAALLPLALLYPLRAWRDAPFFPTPARALHGLGAVVQVPPAQVLDAGCGLGHGLAALQAQWPQAALHGIEWSAPMAWLARRRVPRAQVQRGDMWQLSWATFDLVYLFQRPETMPRAWHKAVAEMRPGSWLVSLEFAVPGVAAQATLDAGGGRPLHVYRLPEHGAAPGRSTAATAGR